MRQLSGVRGYEGGGGSGSLGGCLLFQMPSVKILALEDGAIGKPCMSCAEANWGVKLGMHMVEQSLREQSIVCVHRPLVLLVAASTQAFFNGVHCAGY